jgi:hypothetical protein
MTEIALLRTCQWWVREEAAHSVTNLCVYIDYYVVASVCHCDGYLWSVFGYAFTSPGSSSSPDTFAPLHQSGACASASLDADDSPRPRTFLTLNLVSEHNSRLLKKLSRATIAVYSQAQQFLRYPLPNLSSVNCNM